MSNLQIPSFKSQVLVVGDVMLDRYWMGGCHRISPEAPVPVVLVKDREDRAGGAANVAINIAALNAPCTLVGIIGKDEAGDKLKKLIEDKNITCNCVESESLPTITKLRILSRNQQLIRIDFEDAYESLPQGLILQEMRKSIKNCKVVILSDYGKGALSSVQKMIDIANDEKIPVLIDPKGIDFSRYKNATMLTPNMSEFEAVAGKVTSEEDLVQKALKMIDTYNLKALLVTRSEDGMSLIQKGQKVVHLPTRAREVYDVTGAGDTVIATIGACLASGLDLTSSCDIANRAAGIVVGKLGTSTVSIQELYDDIHKKHNSSHILSKENLLDKIHELKQAGKKIVMTNGCFDILHKGHVDYLKKAKSLGDILIVAVNSDESVQRLKGPTRPIVPLENRMAVLEGLASVDYVVPFDEDTPQSLIAKVLPHILVKGGDYKVEEIAGHVEVLANGGEVKLINFVDGCSTSNIVKKIQNN